MRKITLCIAAGSAAIMTFVDHAASTARFGSASAEQAGTSVNRTLKTDRLAWRHADGEAGAVLRLQIDRTSLADSANPAGAARAGGAGETIVVKWAPASARPGQVANSPAAQPSGHPAPSQGQRSPGQVRIAPKLPEGCELAVSPLSESASIASAARCMASVTSPVRVAALN